ncbi:hypothetical protein Dimus_010366, partial [Dionaea muscipula]
LTEEEPFPTKLESERSIRRRRREKKKRKELAKKLMADHVKEKKNLASYGNPSTSGTRPLIIRPPVAAASFEI